MRSMQDLEQPYTSIDENTTFTDVFRHTEINGSNLPIEQFSQLQFLVLIGEKWYCLPSDKPEVKVYDRIARALGDNPKVVNPVITHYCVKHQYQDLDVHFQPFSTYVGQFTPAQDIETKEGDNGGAGKDSACSVTIDPLGFLNYMKLTQNPDKPQLPTFTNGSARMGISYVLGTGEYEIDEVGNHEKNNGLSYATMQTVDGFVKSLEDEKSLFYGDGAILPGFTLQKSAVQATVEKIQKSADHYDDDFDGVSNQIRNMPPGKIPKILKDAFKLNNCIGVDLDHTHVELGVYHCGDDKIVRYFYNLMFSAADRIAKKFDDRRDILQMVQRFAQENKKAFMGMLHLYYVDPKTGALFPFVDDDTKQAEQAPITTRADFLKKYFKNLDGSEIYLSNLEQTNVNFYPNQAKTDTLDFDALLKHQRLLALWNLHYAACTVGRNDDVNVVKGEGASEAGISYEEKVIVTTMLNAVINDIVPRQQGGALSPRGMGTFLMNFHKEVLNAHGKARGGNYTFVDKEPNSIILASVLASFVHNKPMGECLSLFLKQFSAENASSHLPQTMRVQSDQPKTSRASYRSMRSKSSSQNESGRELKQVSKEGGSDVGDSSDFASNSDTEQTWVFERMCEDVASHFKQELNENGIHAFLQSFDITMDTLEQFLKKTNEPSLVSSIFRIINELRFAMRYPDRDCSDVRKFDGVSYFEHPQIAEPVTVVGFEVPIETVGQLALRYRSSQVGSEISVLVPQKVNGETSSVSASISPMNSRDNTTMSFEFFDIESILIRPQGEAEGAVTFNSLPFRKDAVNRLITAARVNSLFVGKKVFNQKIGKESFLTEETFSKSNHLLLPEKYFLQCRALQLFIDFCLGADRDNKPTRDYFTNLANELGLEGDEASKFLNAQRYWLTALEGLLFSMVICPNGLLPNLVVKLMHRLATASTKMLTSPFRTKIVHFPREGLPWGLKDLSTGKPMREIFPEFFDSLSAESVTVVMNENPLVRSTDRDDFLARVWTPAVEAALTPYVFLNYDSREKLKFSTSRDRLIELLYDLADEASKESFNPNIFTEMLVLYVTLVQLPCKEKAGEQTDLQSMMHTIVTQKIVASSDFQNLHTKLSQAIITYMQKYTENDDSVWMRTLISLQTVLQKNFCERSVAYSAQSNFQNEDDFAELTIFTAPSKEACLNSLGDLVRFLGGRREYDENDSFWNQYKFNLAMLPVTMSAVMASVFRIMDVTEHKNQTQFFSNASTTAANLSPDQELEISIFMVGLTGYLVLQFLERLMSAQDRVGVDPKPWNLFFGSVTMAAMIAAGVYGQVGDPDNRAVEFSGDVSLGLLASSLVANGVDVLKMLAPYVGWPFVTPYIQARLGCKKDATSDQKTAMVESILREFNRWIVTMGTVAAYGVAPLWAFTLLVNVLYDFGASLEGKNNVTSLALRATADGVSEFSILSALVGSYAILNYQINRDLVLPVSLKALLAIGSVFVAMSALNEGAYFSYFVASAVMTNTSIPDWVAFIEEDLKEPIDITCILLAGLLATIAYHVAYQNSEKNNPAKNRLITQGQAISGQRPCGLRKKGSSNNKASLHGRTTQSNATTALLDSKPRNSYAT